MDRSLYRIDRDPFKCAVGIRLSGVCSHIRGFMGILRSCPEYYVRYGAAFFQAHARRNRKAFSAADEIPKNIIRMDINYGTTDMRKLSKYYAGQVFQKVGGNKSQAAKLLGISRPKLDTLLAKHK